MPIERGIRAISAGYVQDFFDIPDTEENISGEVCVSTNDSEPCVIKVAEEWPGNIVLTARIRPKLLKENDDVTVEKTEGAFHAEKMSLYKNPRFDSLSEIRNVNFLCSEITIFYEDIGESFVNGVEEKFYGTSFANYSFDLVDKVIFSKKFLSEKRNIEDSDSPPSVMASSGDHDQPYVHFYSYGGYYKFGDHPQCIESCVFYVKSHMKKTNIRAFPISVLRNRGLDPFADQTLNDGTKIIGVKNFTESQKQNLYDEIKSEKCVIDVTNGNNGEKCRYKSVSLRHIENTDLIKINFKKEQ